MPNIRTMLQAEMRRIARREARAALQRVTAHRESGGRALRGLLLRVARLERSRRRTERLLLRAAAARRQGRGAGVRLRRTALVRGWRRNTVQALRRRLGLSQRELARLLRVSTNSVYLWEAGRITPRPRQQAAVLALRRLRRGAAAARVGRAQGGTAARGRRLARGGARAQRRTRRVARRRGRGALGMRRG